MVGTPSRTSGSPASARPHSRTQGLNASPDPRQCTYQPHIRSPSVRRTNIPLTAARVQEGDSRLDDGVYCQAANTVAHLHPQG